MAKIVNISNQNDPPGASRFTAGSPLLKDIKDTSHIIGERIPEFVSGMKAIELAVSMAIAENSHISRQFIKVIEAHTKATREHQKALDRNTEALNANRR